MRRTYVWDSDAKEMVEVLKQQAEHNSANLLTDLEPFTNPDGAFIKSRSHWRQHLKATDCVEMGHSDIKSSQDDWARKKQLHENKMRNSAQFVKEHTGPGEVREAKRSSLGVEMANKLYNRPTPGRKEMIQLTMETMKGIRQRG